LPGYFGSKSTREDSVRVQEAALKGLAETLKDDHGDSWLEDLLIAGRGSPTGQEAARSLAESERLIQASDNGPAQAAAMRASLLFDHIKIPAGSLRARLDLIMIDQLNHDNRKCAASAHSLSRQLQASSRYPWLEVQSHLEEAACASSSDPRALTLADSAMVTARRHQYPILAIRAANFKSGCYQAAGDWHHSWQASMDALRLFWGGAFPQQRGYNLLANLHDLAEAQQQWFLETAVLKEALPMIASDPDLSMRAFEENRLGEAELRTGDTKGAALSFREARELFARVSPGARRNALEAETEVGLARASLDSGRLIEAAHRFDQVRSSIHEFTDDELQLEFFQWSGIAALRLGRRPQAKGDLEAAVRLAARGSRLAESDIDRWSWRRRNEPAYRALVELDLQTDPSHALHDWQMFKGASLSGPNSAMKAQGGKIVAKDLGRDDDPAVVRLDPGVSYISYAMFQGRASVWLLDRSRSRQIWLSLPEPQTSLLIRRFVEHCSDPASNQGTIRRESAELYKMLLEPFEPWFRGDRALIIEPDGDLRHLPFEILVDSRGQYLGDRYAVSISPGIAYLHRSRAWIGLTPSSDASIVGNPIAPGWIPLPEAEQEARAIAALFLHPRLMIGNSDLDRRFFPELDQSQVFHFSGHASANVQSAGLALGGSALADAFRVQDSTRIHTQLVVLSACNSSLGSAGFFDDEDSFVLRLIGARVPDVVASRWMVDSSATSELMRSFYRALLAGQPASQSLSAARRDVRSQARFAHPYYWAGFSVFGQS
jgi:CHAT domain-containing protein